MYGAFLTAKVQAKRDNDGVEKLVLNEEDYDELLGPQNGPEDWGEEGTDRYVTSDTAEDDPIRFGLAGDFTVERGENSVLIAVDGSKYAL